MTLYTLSACDISISYQGQVLFNPLSFSVSSQEILKITGLNGSGKTTLLRIIAGLRSPSQGTLRWKSNDQTLSTPFKAKYISITPPLKKALLVYEQLILWYALQGNVWPNPLRKVRQHLAYFALDNLWNTPVRYLSAGQQHCLNLCQLFLGSCPLWILDEPFAHLDNEQASRLNHLITAHLQKEGLIIIAMPRNELNNKGKELNLDQYKGIGPSFENEIW